MRWSKFGNSKEREYIPNNHYPEGDRMGIEKLEGKEAEE